jgi:hypothetical protein
VLSPGRVAAFDFAPFLALAEATRRDVVAAVRFAAVPAFAPVAFGDAELADRVPREDLPEVVADLEVPVLAEDVVVLAVRDLAVVEAGLGAADLLAFARADASGLATDIALAAAVRDFDAAVIALVAVFIACMAVDIVLADDVAFVAAAVILVAALVTFVAADETVRAALVADGALLDVDAAGRVVRPVDADAAGCVVRPAAAPPRRDALLLLADLVRVLLAALRRAVVRVVVRAGTDLPPLDQSRTPIPRPTSIYTPDDRRRALELQNNGPKQTENSR